MSIVFGDRELASVERPIVEARGLPNEAYTSAQWAALERERVLGTSWTCTGFVDDVLPGHAAPVDLLGLPLLVVRDGAGTSRVFHNVCRHRGHRLVEEPCDLGGRIRCPYHSWTYALDGALRGPPHVGGPGVHEVEGLDRSKHGLLEVRAAEWLGLLFVNLSGDATTLEAHLAPLLERWAPFVGAGGLDLLSPAWDNGSLELTVAANWKLAVENYCESYHLPWVHPGLNGYSRLEDHYEILQGEAASGQGTRAFCFTERAGIELPRFPAWPRDRVRTAEYISLYPNVLLGVHVDHFYALVLTPLACDCTLERLRIYYLGDAAEGHAFGEARATLLQGWRQVFAEDVGVVEGMQDGRRSPAFDGGVFSPVMDRSTHHFHRWVARRMAQADTSGAASG
jgi:choline monooxygenase